MRKKTTLHPRLQVSRELLGLACELLHRDSLRQAERWCERYLQWCEFWVDFLGERSYGENGWSFTHEPVRQARSTLFRLLNQGTLFTYLDPQLTTEGSLPRTNNVIEGGINAQLRVMLRNHRGLSLMRRVKAVFWWCYLHTENPRSPKEILASMPTDDDIDFLYCTYCVAPK